jgi:hypothetical protein
MIQAPVPSTHQLKSHLPIILLLAVLLLTGLLTFRDYGLSWDEPLFYDYGQASRYAYSISARLDGTFDIEKSFGASASDHVTRGPAYLLIGGLAEGLLEKTGLDLASAWHLTNFLTYLVGLTFFYLLARFFLDPWPAAAATAFFATQPVFWNHAFINPKDSPFAIFFLISVYLGFKMVDQWNEVSKARYYLALQAILPGMILGVTAAIRFLAPYAVLLIFLYFLSKPNWKSIWWGFLPYGVIAIVTMIALWPFLWSNPIGQFTYTLRAMSETSANLKTLFMGVEYSGYDLPRRYFPFLLTTTLTEPTWPLFLLGLAMAFYKSFQKKFDRLKLSAIFLWFGMVITLLVAVNPANSDGYRHYLFILPPVFLFAGMGINEIFKRVKMPWIQIGLVAILLFPAIFADIRLHPYQYAYYNSFVGGTKTAFRNYETEYWLTCYKEAMKDFNAKAPQNARIYIKREPNIAAYYARADLSVLDYRTDFKFAQPGDYLLVSSRSNEDTKTLRGAPIFLEVGREGAVFCAIKLID